MAALVSVSLLAGAVSVIMIIDIIVIIISCTLGSKDPGVQKLKLAGVALVQLGRK